MTNRQNLPAEVRQSRMGRPMGIGRFTILRRVNAPMNWDKGKAVISGVATTDRVEQFPVWLRSPRSLWGAADFCRPFGGVVSGSSYPAGSKGPIH